MKSITKYTPFTLLILMLGVLISSPVQAHLMVARHGDWKDITQERSFPTI